MTKAPDDPPEAVEDLIRLAAASPFGSRVIATLLRRILELQDDASEEELLSLVARLEQALRAEDPAPY